MQNHDTHLIYSVCHAYMVYIILSSRSYIVYTYMHILHIYIYIYVYAHIYIYFIYIYNYIDL